MKRVIEVSPAPRPHWVGDGFPVRSLFSYATHGEPLSPFLLLDHAGPREFAPAKQPRGVGEHPHRGFETVTIVYQGEVAHRDSTGQGGIIGPGDVQWMTAGAGILHEEFHSEAFTRQGGMLEMVQLWVNLPAKDKLTPPRYQAIRSEQIPAVALPAGAGTVRVIAGSYDGHAGPAQTHSPMEVWDVRLQTGAQVVLPVQAGWNTALIVLQGTVELAGDTIARPGQLVQLDHGDGGIAIESNNEAILKRAAGR